MLCDSMSELTKYQPKLAVFICCKKDFYQQLGQQGPWRQAYSCKETQRAMGLKHI